MKYIDMRSDTVTQPTQLMRDAIYQAEVGDDIMGDDPTVAKLEAMTAKLFHKEAALFLASGTMANQVAVMTLTNRGDEIILSDRSHLFNLESGALAALCQVQTRTVPIENGAYPVDRLEALIRPTGVQQPKTSLICLENTCDLNTGLVLPLSNVQAVVALAKKYDLPVFLDGARIFNAAVALGVEVHQLVEGIDAVMFALTKGLSAPFGAMLVGTQEFIDNARYQKQRLGGGFRQAGFMAAAGIVAIETMIERLAEDHRHAKMLGEMIQSIHQVTIDLSQLHTNILTFSVETSSKMDEVVQKLKDKGILVKRIAPLRVRLVTHREITQDMVEYVYHSLRDIMEER